MLCLIQSFDQFRLFHRFRSISNVTDEKLHRLKKDMIRREPSGGRDDGDEPPLKSKKSVHYSFIRFLNTTGRKVDVVWVNYQGARVRYKTLLPLQYLDINTFVGHPWIFFDAETGDKMMVQLKEIFEPVAWNGNGEQVPQRKTVNITLPVYTLQDCCLKKLRGLMPKSSINELEIPDIMKAELHKTYASSSYCKFSGSSQAS